MYVAHPFLQQPPGVLGIRLQALGLAVRAKGAPDFDAFVPMQAHPPQILEDSLLGFAGRPLQVGVFDAKDERALLTSGEQPVEQGRARVADVQVTGGGRSETQPHPEYRILCRQSDT